MFGCMLKYASPLLCIIFLFGSCQQSRKELITADEIYRIHQRIDSLEADSVYPMLKNFQKKLEKNNTLPDSLRMENSYLLGQHFKKLEKMDSAAIYFHRATDFIKDSIYTNRQGQCFQEAWNTYYHLGRFGDCFIISKNFKSLLKSDLQFSTLSWALSWEKNTYNALGDYENALKTNELQVNLAKNHDPKNLPMALAARADLKYYRLNDKDGAFVIMEDLLKNEDSLTNNFKRIINGNYAIFQYYEGNYRKALEHYLKAVEGAKKDTTSADYLNQLANTYNNTAEVYLDLKEFENARNYLDSVRLLGINNLASSKQKSLFKYELRLAANTNKDIKEVLSLMDSIYLHQDKAYKAKFDDELFALEKSSENEKLLLRTNQETEVKNLKLQTRNWIILISTGLLTLIGLLFYQRRKLKFEKSSLQNQQRLLRSQMNPHFTFNSLYAIQNQIKIDPEKGAKYLPKFSRLLRLVLENSMNDYVLLEKEIESLKKYMEFQSLQSTNAFEYEITFENMEEDEFIFIPPMLLQPFVENSIQHGFSGIDHPGRIDIQLALKGKYIYCKIEDNGNGFDKSSSQHKKSASISLISNFLKKSTKKEVEIINKKQINPSKSGIIVQLLIPYKLTEND